MLVACFAVPQLGIACERARLRDVQEQPLALAGADGLLRVISDEACAFGIQPGQTLSSARVLCRSLLVLPYDRAAYEDAARCLWDLFAIESSTVEPVSPELCFVEMTGPDIPDIHARVQRLAAAVATRVGIPVSVGLARSKFVAQQAAIKTDRKTDRAAGVVIIPVGQEAAFLAPLSLDRVPGLDYKQRQRLERLGVRRFGDVLRLPPRQLQRQFREIGHLLHRLSLGADGEQVKPLWPPSSLEEVVRFEDEAGEATCDEATLHEALRRCAESIAHRLAGRREFCRRFTLTVGLSDGTYRQQQERLALPADDAQALFRTALRLLQRLCLEQYNRPVREVLVRATDLGAGSGVQLALLDENPSLSGHAGLPHERRARLEATLAYLRQRFPHSAPVLASLLRQARRIGLWTYPLGHMLRQPVEVATSRTGEPVRYWGRRHRRLYEGEVRSIHTRWKETTWAAGRTTEEEVWRVETDPNGLAELHRLGVEWSLGAVAD